MEYVVALILIGAVGFFIWDYKQTKKAELSGTHPLDGVTKNTIVEEPVVITVAETAPAPKKAKKPAAPKKPKGSGAVQPKKPKTKKEK